MIKVVKGFTKLIVVLVVAAGLSSVLLPGVNRLANATPLPTVVIPVFNIANESNPSAGYQKSITATAGDTLDFYIEVQNTAGGTVANDTTIKASIPSGEQSSFNINANVSSSNGGSFDNSTTVNLNSPSKLNFVAGSVRVTWDPNGNTPKQYQGATWSNSDQIISGGINFGDFKGSNPYIMQISFKATVARPPVVEATPNCSVTKKIRLPNGNEVTSVSASDHVFSPGEEIVYRLFISNSGTGDASNFSLSDFLPTYIFWVSGDGGYAAGENKVNFDLGTLKAKESRTLTYKAKVRDNIPSGQVSQTNNARVTSPSNLTCTTSSTLTIGKPGAILAATALPQTGAVPTSVLATLGLVVTGIITRLRKIKTTRYWNK